MVLYFVIFGNLIGRQIGDMGGFTYMEYIVPGLIMMSVITNSYGNVVSSFFGSKFQRFDRRADGLAGIAAHHSRRLCARRRVAWPGCRGDRDHPVDVLHPSAGASPGCHCRGGAADRDHLLAAGLRQRRVRAQFRRYLDHSDVRADAVDLPRWGVLFDQLAAAILADRVVGEPGTAHGQLRSATAS